MESPTPSRVKGLNKLLRFSTNKPADHPNQQRFAASHIHSSTFVPSCSPNTCQAAIDTMGGYLQSMAHRICFYFCLLTCWVSKHCPWCGTRQPKPHLQQRCMPRRCLDAHEKWWQLKQTTNSVGCHLYFSRSLEALANIGHNAVLDKVHPHHHRANLGLDMAQHIHFQ